MNFYLIFQSKELKHSKTLFWMCKLQSIRISTPPALNNEEEVIWVSELACSSPSWTEFLHLVEIQSQNYSSVQLHANIEWERHEGWGICPEILGSTSGELFEILHEVFFVVCSPTSVL